MPRKPKQLKGHVLFEILTTGIYTTFTRAIKEAVSNAYDAGADNVHITFDPPTFLEHQNPTELTIQIRDDGRGMSLEDFWEKFASIESEKNPRLKSPTTGRYPIGKFGIGSFALAPFSLRLTLYSKRRGHQPIKCVIDTVRLRHQAPDDFPQHVRNHISDEEITDEQWNTLFGSNDPGTVIVINGVTDETYTELVEGTEQFEDNGKAIFPNAKLTIGLKEVAWELSTLLPLKYAEDPGEVYKHNRSSLRSNNPGIDISLSGLPLHRHIYSQPDSLVKTVDYHDKENGVRAKGVLVAIPEGAIKPRLANGVILRINNVGIGTYSRFGLVGQPTIRGRITGEVHIVEGLHDALNAPRDRFSGAVYDRLKKHIAESLADLSSEAYSEWKDEQKQQTESTEKAQARKHKQAYQKREQEKKERSPGRSTVHRKSKKKRGAPTKGQKPTAAQFKDPVVDMRTTSFKMSVDESHELFKKYKGKAEKETIKLVLRAMHLAEVPDDLYRRVVESLIVLK